MYYDTTAGRNRVKRRYVWAFWGFLAGVVTVEALRYLL